MMANRKSLPSFSYESLLWDKKIQYVVGVDEAGRGAFAGPLYVAGVVFEPYFRFEKTPIGLVNDSKLLKNQVRENLEEEIKKYALCFAVSEIPLGTINKIGIGKATFVGVRQVIRSIADRLDGKQMHLLMDGFRIPYVRLIGTKRQTAIVKGDRLSVSIAAASILAKVGRDRKMKDLHRDFPLYGFSRHVGYGTKAHRKAIQAYGFCKLHRKSFDLQKHLAI